MTIQKKLRPFYHPDQGKDMLKLAITFEILRALVTLGINYKGFNDPLSTGIMGLAFFFIVFSITKYVYPIKLKDLGLKKLYQWSKSEKLLLIFVPAITLLLFYFIRDKVNIHIQENGLNLFAFTLICYFLWGFYIEWIYRGFLQTELTRRYGPVTAIILSNALFLIGSIHIFHVFDYNLWIILSIFFIGLLCSVIFYRTYNLWIVAILQGIAYCFFFLLQ